MVRTSLTVDDYERVISQPENDERLFEYIDGEIVEVVTNTFCSLVALRIGGRIMVYVEEHDLGYTTGEAGGYQVGDNRYLPDVGFISKKRQPESPHGTFISNPPDLAVEVISPTDQPKKVRTKTANYVAVGTVVWLVDPEAQEIEVHSPGKAVKTYHFNDTLDGGDILPGFKIVLKDIFKP